MGDPITIAMIGAKVVGGVMESRNAKKWQILKRNLTKDKL